VDEPGKPLLAGFAIRGRELVVYSVAEGEEQRSLLSKLGKHKMGKACLYFKQLADLDRSAGDVPSPVEIQRRLSDPVSHLIAVSATRL
jgi:hypothetical protein